MQVGPGQTYARPSQAAAAAVNGDVVVIRAGDYVGDVAVWGQNNLTICGSGGRARLFANGNNAAGKGTWVIQGDNVVVDSLEFHDARVPDENGAGIRAEGNGLTILNSGFYNNQNGILGPDFGDLTIERSEFARNGAGGVGFTHNIYVVGGNRLTVRSSFFHQAHIGHNLKSRALFTTIENSYFMDGSSGTASYQVDVPNGGTVFMRGNMLQKGPLADNSILISYGSEGLYANVTHTLTLMHNTLVSTYAGGSFISAAGGVQSIVLKANLFAGSSTSVPRYNSGVAAKVTESNNLMATSAGLPGATNLAAPNFWPTDALAASTVLANVPDATLQFDAPRPYTLRTISTGAPRRIGALQSPP